MSFWASLLTWANVPFAVALGVATAFALLQVTGVLGLLAGGDADAEGHDADVDADAGGHDGHDGDADGDEGVVHGFLESLGVGRIPTSIVWQTYFFAFGLTGLLGSALVLSRSGAPPPPASLAWSVPLALAVGYGATRGVASLLGRVLDNPVERATSRRELVGQQGVVISTRVGAEFGEVRLRDKSGHVVRLVVRTREADIEEGREIVVVDCDEATGHLFVVPFEDGAARR